MLMPNLCGSQTMHCAKQGGGGAILEALGVLGVSNWTREMGGISWPSQKNM